MDWNPPISYSSLDNPGLGGWSDRADSHKSRSSQGDSEMKWRRRVFLGAVFLVCLVSYATALDAADDRPPGAPFSVDTSIFGRCGADQLAYSDIKYTPSAGDLVGIAVVLTRRGRSVFVDLEVIEGRPVAPAPLRSFELDPNGRLKINLDAPNAELHALKGKLTCRYLRIDRFRLFNGQAGVILRRERRGPWWLRLRGEGARPAEAQRTVGCYSLCSGGGIFTVMSLSSRRGFLSSAPYAHV